MNNTNMTKIAGMWWGSAVMWWVEDHVVEGGISPDWMI